MNPEGKAHRDTVGCCPECDSTDIQRRNTHSLKSTGYDDPGKWYCNGCKSAFDDPDQRLRERDAPHGRGGTVAAKLAAMDPDEL